MTETPNVGEPHPTDAEPNVFTGADPNADTGEPDNLNADIGIPAPPG